MNNLNNIKNGVKDVLKSVKLFDSMVKIIPRKEKIQPKISNSGLTLRLLVLFLWYDLFGYNAEKGS